MSPEKRVLLIVLLVLVVFGVVLALGWSGRKDGDSTERPDWLAMLSDGLPGSPPVEASSLSASCFTGVYFSVRASQPCLVTVEPGSQSVRLLKLQLVTGNKVQVHLEAGGSPGINLTVPVRAGKPKVPDLQVLKDGANVTLTCELPPPGPPAPCLLGLRQ